MKSLIDPRNKRYVIGLQKMLTESRVFNDLRNLRLVEKLLIQGLILTVVLIVVQTQLDNDRQYLMSYMPPIGFALLIFTTYLVQPLFLGVWNILIINTLFKTEGWQVGFLLNGIFLLLRFSTLNLVMQTALNLSFTCTAIIGVVVFEIPLGFIARLTTGDGKSLLTKLSYEIRQGTLWGRLFFCGLAPLTKVRIVEWVGSFGFKKLVSAVGAEGSCWLWDLWFYWRGSCCFSGCQIYWVFIHRWSDFLSKLSVQWCYRYRKK